MMAHTPNATPLREYNPHLQQKKLPLIVDIAIDTNGKQMYQVHELAKPVRKEMPRLTQFLSVPYPMEFGGELAAPFEEEKTPVRGGPLLPSLMTQACDVFERKQFPPPPAMPVFNFQMPQMYIDPGAGSALGGVVATTPSATSADEFPVSTVPRSQDNDIWLDDVENAFEEVLQLIPKNGLNKIKISGRSCGRNELISDYILSKTGKFRTRKQVSLHIQVIKNLGQKIDVIKLINDGPVFATEHEHQENLKRFEEIFSKINLSKLLGFANEEGNKRKALYSTPSGKRPRKALTLLRFDKVGIDNFSMVVVDAYGLNTMYLSMLDPANRHREVPALKVNDNYNVQLRFPGLSDFSGCSRTPIIHNMVKVAFPSQLPYNYDLEHGFRALFTLQDKLAPVTPVHLPTRPLMPSHDAYSVFTAVYLYGNEVIKFNEDNIHLNEDTPFLTKFWKFFIGKFLGKDDAKVQLAFKGMTIKQIVYERDGCSEAEVHQVPKNKIKMVLLWEFATVNDLKDAITTTSRLVLPTKEQTGTPQQPPQQNVQRKFQLLQQQAYTMPMMVPPPMTYSQYHYQPSLHHLANVDLMMMPPQVPEFGGLLYPEGFQEY